MTKYQEYFKRMLAENTEAFDTFRKAHDAYSKDMSLQEAYNEAGKPIIELIRTYEDKLCNHSEGSGYASYSGNLAEKFWGEVRAEFPMIDRVGVIIKKGAPINEPEKEFELKKIEVFELRKINL